MNKRAYKKREERPVLDRLLSKVEIDAITSCWNWTACKDHRGYGKIGIKIDTEKKTMAAHRVSYQIHCSPIPAGLNVLHRCDNPACINPEHLFLGTLADNTADMIAKGRQARGEKTSNKGTDHGGVKITEAAAIFIRSARGISQRKLAARFGIGRTQVKRIRSGASWAHLRP